jgi:hypothetical protein
MPDLKKMTLEGLRALARKLLGPGQSRKSKAELVAALGAEQGRKPTEKRPPARAGARKAGAGKGAASKGAASKAAGKGAGTKGAKESSAGRARKARKVASVVATVAGAAVGAAAGALAARRGARAATGPKRKAAPTKGGPPPHAAEGPDPDGYFVARVRGEDALRDAPHSMAESTGEGWAEEETPGATVHDEQLGDLPWGYGDDAFVALPRDPRTLFLYWDWAQATLARAFEGLDRPRTQLWVFASVGDGWDRVRILEFALESRGFYVHDLEPGRVYRAEIHVLGRGGGERLLAAPSNPCALPPAGPSAVIDDRFVRIPWEMPLGQLLGPGHAGGPFGDDVRAQLARLSDWSRFSGPTWGGSAGGMGGRPFSPTSGPSSPSSPFGGGR